MKRYCAFILAISMILTACGQNTPTWQEQYDLGIRYLSEGNYNEAIIAFTAAIEIDPNQALAYVGRGDAYVGLGGTEENLAVAQTDYEQAVELDETLAEAYLGLADVYIRQDEYEKALELLQNIIGKTSDNPAVEEKISELESLQADSLAQEGLEEYSFQVQTTENAMDMEAENLTVHIQDGRTATITVSGLSLQDDYLTNLRTSKKDIAEYGWRVEMYSDQEAYSVSTASWAFDPGAEETKSISNMQHSVWIYGEGTSWSVIADAEMTYTKNSITWTFTIPEEYPFDFAGVNRYEVNVKDISRDLNFHRIYTRE